MEKSPPFAAGIPTGEGGISKSVKLLDWGDDTGIEF